MHEPKNSPQIRLSPPFSPIEIVQIGTFAICSDIIIVVSSNYTTSNLLLGFVIIFIISDPIYSNSFAVAIHSAFEGV